MTTPLDPRAPIIAGTDGSSRGNPGPAGWAWAISDTEWASGGWAKETNNVAELTALRELLTAVPTGTALEVRSDSTYVIDALVGRGGKRPWIVGWKRSAWLTAAGKPVANKDLMVAIDALLVARTAPTTITWVKAHKATGGDPYNEMADRRAYAASSAILAGSTPFPGPGLRSATPGRGGLCCTGCGTQWVSLDGGDDAPDGAEGGAVRLSAAGDVTGYLGTLFCVECGLRNDR